MIARFSRWKAALAFIGSVGFVVASWWILTAPQFQGSFARLFSLAGIAFFGVTGLYTLFAVFDPRSTLTIDANGVFDRRTMDRPVPWSDVWGLSVMSMGNREFYYLDTGLPYDRYTNQPLKRWLLKANLGFGGGIVVSPYYLDMKPQKVAAVLLEQEALAAPDVLQIFDRLRQQNRLAEHCLLPCAPSEIAEVRAHFGCDLPKAYEQFLRIAGRGAGRLFADEDIYYPAVLGLQDGARKLIADNGLPTECLPDDAIVFMAGRGEGWFGFFRPNADDPQVFWVDVTHGEALGGESLSHAIRQEVRARLAERRTLDI